MHRHSADIIKTRNMSIAALLQAAEYIERRERGSALFFSYLF